MSSNSFLIKSFSINCQSIGSFKKSYNELKYVKIVSNRSLLHHGIRALLVQQIQIKNYNNTVGRQILVQQGKSSPSSLMTLNEVRVLMIGQRVATIYNPTAIINKSTGNNSNNNTN